jgi:hypothetical protein
MFNQHDILVAQQRRRDMLSAAAKYRLTRIALEARGQRPHLYDRWLARFGGWLIDLGSRLEARYAPPPVCCSSTGD